MPEWIDYSDYLTDSQDYINEASIFFFLYCLFLIIGILGAKFCLRVLGTTFSKFIDKDSHQYISLFHIRAKWIEFLKISNIIVSGFLLLQVFSLVVYKIGITGYLYNDYSHSIILALSEITRYFLPIGIFCLILGLHSKQKIILQQAILLIFLVFLSYLLIASRAVFLYALMYAIAAIQLIGIDNPQKYVRLLIKFVLLAVISYPLVTYSRYIYLDQEVISLYTYLLQFDLVKEISLRLGTSVESYFLWYKYISINTQEQLLTFQDLFIRCINGLIPGSIFSEENLVNLSKLQVSIGRPEVPYYSSDQFLDEIGGHGENPGIYGQSYILLKSLSPILFLVSGFLATLIEGSKINIFWKYYWISYLLITPWLMPTSITIKQIVVWLLIISFIVLIRTLLTRPGKKFRINFNSDDFSAR